tara:strand:+ start:1959 stop:2225 length:267 start_codon:yes stop_codon:yes gene_type:complete
LLLRDLYPINAAINVNTLIPPSIGTQGGGQHPGDGGPGCEKQLIEAKIKINTRHFLFVIYYKFMFLFKFFMLKLDICIVFTIINYGKK